MISTYDIDGDEIADSFVSDVVACAANDNFDTMVDIDHSTLPNMWELSKQVAPVVIGG